MSHNMLGYDVDGNTLQQMLDNSNNGASFTDNRKNLAYSATNRNNLASMSHNMLGYDVDGNTLQQMLDNSNNGTSFTDNRNYLADSKNTQDQYIHLYERMMGRDFDHNNSYDTDWYNWQITQLKAGKSFQELNNGLAHDERVGNHIIANYERMMGRDFDHNGSYDTDWYNWQITQLEAGKSFQELNSGLAHDERVKSVIVNMAKEKGLQLT